MDYSKYMIRDGCTLLDALSAINNIGTSPLTLLVLDGDGRMFGTLTDGDIRRAQLQGHGLDTPVRKIAHTACKFIRDDDDHSVEQIRAMREAKIQLVPVLDQDNRIVDLIDLTRNRTRLPIDAILMAGGKGERLRPLTDKTPKPLLPVGDKAIIDHNVDRLITYGVKHINVTVNYLKEQIQEHYAIPRNGVKVECVSESQYLGTVGSVRFVEKLHNDTVLVMNSDVFTNLDYESFYLHFKEYNADMSVVAVPYSIAVPYGIMDLDGRKLKGMIEKPTYNYYANGGIYLIRRQLLDLIPEGEFFNATDLIDRLIDRGHNVIRFPINGIWIDIGNPQEYQKAMDMAKHL